MACTGAQCQFHYFDCITRHTAHGRILKEKLRPYVIKYKEYIDELEKDNPYGVPLAWATGQER
jgi:hypothetical protein